MFMFFNSIYDLSYLLFPPKTLHAKKVKNKIFITGDSNSKLFYFTQTNSFTKR